MGMIYYYREYEGADAHIRPFNPSVTYGDSSAQGTPCGRPKGSQIASSYRGGAR